MKKLIFITCLFSATLLGDGIDSTQYKFTIYPELVGLGGLPSINIEYIIEDYSIRGGIGMIVMAADTYPIAIYKTFGKDEIGVGLFIADGGSGMQIGVVAAYNWKKKSNWGTFRRIGILGGFSNMSPIIIPTLGWGFNF